MSEVRVRFAPSPTGHLHLGGARTALFTWLFARHNNGKFILRVEDTDQERSTKEAEAAVIEDLKWLGLQWDEGPEVGGEFGPYNQMERLDLYKEYGEKLLEQKLAYKCYCTDEHLKKKRDEAFSKGEVPQYDGACRDLTPEEQQVHENEGKKAAIRFTVPKGSQKVEDLIRGSVEFPEGMVGDFIILRQDHVPTYNFAVVVDDALMKITHVLRAEEHLSNTNRQLMLFKALGFDVPQFAHFSIIMGKDEEGKVSKLSKRHGATSVNQYQEVGYLPEALVNYLALLGWSHPEAKEKMPIDELIKSFDVSRCTKSSGIFDPDKLNWMSGLYIRELPPEEAAKYARPFLESAGSDLSRFNDESFVQAVDAVRGQLNMFSEIPKYFTVFLDDKFSLDDPAKELLSDEDSKKVVEALKYEINGIDSLTADSFKEIQNRVKESTGQKGKKLFQPMRAAITGSLSGPELHRVVPILGKESILKRIDKALKG